MAYLRRYNILLLLLFVLLMPLVSVHAQGITVTVQVQATLHDGPGRDFPPRGGVSPNTTVPALGRSADNAWIQVNASGTIGWLAAIQVTVNGNLASLPVTAGQGGTGSASAGPTKVPPVTPPNTRSVVITARQIYLWLRWEFYTTSVSIGANQLAVVGPGTLNGVPKVFTNYMSVSVVNGALAATMSTLEYDGHFEPAGNFAPEGLNYVNTHVSHAMNQLLITLIGQRTVVSFVMDQDFITVIYAV